jgi:hypothetical protein
MSVTLTVPPAVLWAWAGLPVSDTTPAEITHRRAGGVPLGRCHYRVRDLEWSGNSLRLRSDGRVLATIVPDAEWSGLWRVRIGGRLSDMVNRTRAKDAAQHAALAALNRQQELEP